MLLHRQGLSIAVLHTGKVWITQLHRRGVLGLMVPYRRLMLLAEFLQHGSMYRCFTLQAAAGVTAEQAAVEVACTQRWQLLQHTQRICLSAAVCYDWRQ